MLRSASEALGGNDPMNRDRAKSLQEAAVLSQRAWCSGLRGSRSAVYNFFSLYVLITLKKDLISAHVSLNQCVPLHQLLLLAQRPKSAAECRAGQLLSCFPCFQHQGTEQP